MTEPDFSANSTRLHRLVPLMALAAGMGVCAVSIESVPRNLVMHNAARYFVADQHADMTISWTAPAACAIGLALLLLWGSVTRATASHPRLCRFARPIERRAALSTVLLRRLHFGGLYGP